MTSNVPLSSLRNVFLSRTPLTMNDQVSEPGIGIDPERTRLFAGARGTAVKVLNRVERTDSYLEKVLDSELKAGDLSDADKGLLNELAHGVMRWQNRLDWVLNGFSHGNFAKSEINVKNALRVALYQILFLDRIPHSAAVNEAVEFVKRIRGDRPAGLVNAVLRNILRNLDGIRYPDPAEDRLQYFSVYYSHPSWLIRRWVDRFGEEETQKLLIANNERPSLSLRINRLKVEPGEFLRLLDEQRISYSGSEYLGHFVRVRGLSRIGQMELFRAGYFTIQDESAALPALLLDPQPGETILDLCAAPGGKATAMSELMKNQGEILAVDRYEAKIAQIRGAAERLGLRNINAIVADALTFQHDPVDRVLVDAPCSGTGILTKKPDIKWKREARDIPPLVRLQGDLLENGARLVRGGGVLVYSTCSIEPEENERVLRAFLERHAEFVIERASEYVSKALVTEEGFVATYPHRHGMDGSFAVRLRRSG